MDKVPKVHYIMGQKSPVKWKQPIFVQELSWIICNSGMQACIICSIV